AHLLARFGVVPTQPPLHQPSSLSPIPFSRTNPSNRQPPHPHSSQPPPACFLLLNPPALVTPLLPHLTHLDESEACGHGGEVLRRRLEPPGRGRPDGSVPVGARRKERM
uniref:Uncharacterized protein n=1 Tax=Triticum urartu TaxID=4572 RepID=A0A8R7Q4I9_TRIUA